MILAEFVGVVGGRGAGLAMESAEIDRTNFP